MPMSYVRACHIWGNGDFRRGQQVIFKAAERIEYARAKHPWPRDAADATEAALALLGEAEEVVQAAAHEGPERTRDEFFDTIAVAVRGINEEWRER